QRDSIHHVAPASAHLRVVSLACAESLAGVSPSIIISNGVVRVRFSATNALIARRSSGVSSRRTPFSSVTSGRIPSQRSTRRIDFGRGHIPTDQIGMRGCCLGGGGAPVKSHGSI